MIKLLIFDFCGTLAACGASDYQYLAQKLRDDFNLPVAQNDILQLSSALSEFLVTSQNWEELTNKVIQKLGLIIERDRREKLTLFLKTIIRQTISRYAYYFGFAAKKQF